MKRFLQHATLLSSGVVVAQAIPLLMLPVFSRMFPAEYFALQALLLMGIAVLVPIATGFYELAIPIPRQQAQARSLATFVTIIASALSFLSLVLIHFYSAPMLKLFQLDALGEWIYAYPPLILCTALINVANYWLLRQGKLMLQSISRVSLTLSIAVITVIAGLRDWQGGLLTGFVLGTIVGSACALFIATACSLELRWPLPKRYLERMIYKYRQFPLYGSVPTAINNLAIYMPVLLVTAHYALATSGHYAVTRNLMAGGLGLIAAGIGQVVLKHVAEYAQKRERIWPHYVRMMGVLLAAGVALAVTVYLIGPWFFTLYLGHGWEDTGTIARLLSFNLPLWLTAPAMAQAAVALRQVRPIALWQILYGISSCSLILFIQLPFEEFLRRVVIFEIVAYALYLLIITLAIHRHEKRHF